jgi:hypothetical protein
VPRTKSESLDRELILTRRTPRLTLRWKNTSSIPIVELFALVTNEDERSNKLLTVALELRPDQIAPDDLDALSREVFEQLAAANQDFRESRRMIPAGLEPRLQFFASRTGPFAGKDIRLKSKYIQETKS